MSEALPSPAKRSRPNVGSALKKPGPDYDKGIEYWNDVEASVDGVLGGFGTGPVPHIEQLSSRLLLLSLLPSLHTFPNPMTPSPPPRPAHRLTVLDVGAGIGRVSRHVLLPLFEDVVMVEPVDKFVSEAYRSARDGEWRDLPSDPSLEKDQQVGDRGKRVWFVKGGLQGLDPKYPGQSKTAETIGVVGTAKGGEPSEGFNGDGEVTYDVVWCQWCLGHMSTPDLIPFFKLARSALRDSSTMAVDGESKDSNTFESLMFVKENCCEDGQDGKPVEFLDESDSSLTRSAGKWREIFKDAGLEIIREEVQEGMPDELFVVRTWALR